MAVAAAGGESATASAGARRLSVNSRAVASSLLPGHIIQGTSDSMMIRATYWAVGAVPGDYQYQGHIIAAQVPWLRYSRRKAKAGVKRSVSTAAVTAADPACLFLLC